MDVISPLNNNKSHWTISMQRETTNEETMKDIKELFVLS